MCACWRTMTIDADSADGAAVFLHDQTTAHNLRDGRARQGERIAMHDKALRHKIGKQRLPAGSAVGTFAAGREDFQHGFIL